MRGNSSIVAQPRASVLHHRAPAVDLVRRADGRAHVIVADGERGDRTRHRDVDRPRRHRPTVAELAELTSTPARHRAVVTTRARVCEPRRDVGDGPRERDVRRLQVIDDITGPELAIRVGAPARERPVGPHRARVKRARLDALHVASDHRRRNAAVDRGAVADRACAVASPALHLVSRVEDARVVAARHDLGRGRDRELARRQRRIRSRAELTERVVAPARHAAAGDSPITPRAASTFRSPDRDPSASQADTARPRRSDAEARRRRHSGQRQEVRIGHALLAHGARWKVAGRVADRATRFAVLATRSRDHAIVGSCATRDRARLPDRDRAPWRTTNVSRAGGLRRVPYPGALLRGVGGTPALAERAALHDDVLGRRIGEPTIDARDVIAATNRCGRDGDDDKRALHRSTFVDRPRGCEQLQLADRDPSASAALRRPRRAG